MCHGSVFHLLFQRTDGLCDKNRNISTSNHLRNTVIRFYTQLCYDTNTHCHMNTHTHARARWCFYHYEDFPSSRPVNLILTQTSLTFRGCFEELVNHKHIKNSQDVKVRCSQEVLLNIIYSGKLTRFQKSNV